MRDLLDERLVGLIRGHQFRVSELRRLS